MPDDVTRPARRVDSLVSLDAGWQALEARLCAAVLIIEIASLTLWIGLNGLAKDYVPGQNAGGLVFRGLVSAAVLGSIAHLTTRKRKPGVHAMATTGAVVLGLLGGRSWAHFGVHYASNLLNWLQNASSLMLVGGLRGLVTRLTLWVALLGASLATSKGKHIHVDVVLRFLPKPLRKPAAIVGQLGASLVCGLAVVGFVDHIAIAQFRASAVHPCAADAARSCDSSAAERLKRVREGVSEDLFLLGRQASLDVRSLPRVAVGQPYDQWMTASEWNGWLDGADWGAHFPQRAVEALRMDASNGAARAVPQVSAPGTGEQAAGLLARELNFVFPFGLMVIALKLLLRAALLVLGRIPADADAAHTTDDGLSRAEERDNIARGAGT